MFSAHLRLLGSQFNPKPSHCWGMLGFFNDLIISHLNALSIWPDHIKAIFASALNEHSVKESMNKRKELALITKEAHYNKSQGVVVHVDNALWCNAPCLPHNSREQSDRPNAVVLEATYGVVVQADISEYYSN